MRTNTYLFKDKEIVEYMLSFQTGITARQMRAIIKMLMASRYGHVIDDEDIRLYRPWNKQYTEIDQNSLYPSDI